MCPCPYWKLDTDIDTMATLCQIGSLLHCHYCPVSKCPSLPAILRQPATRRDPVKISLAVSLLNFSRQTVVINEKLQTMKSCNNLLQSYKIMFSKKEWCHLLMLMNVKMKNSMTLNLFHAKFCHGTESHNLIVNFVFIICSIFDEVVEWF